MFINYYHTLKGIIIVYFTWKSIHFSCAEFKLLMRKNISYITISQKPRDSAHWDKRSHSADSIIIITKIKDARW